MRWKRRSKEIHYEKKLIAITILALCTALYTGCQGTDNNVINNSEEGSKIIEQSEASRRESIDSEGSGCGQEEGILAGQRYQADIEPEPVVSAASAFRAVLLNEMTFSCSGKVPHCYVDADMPWEGLLCDQPYGPP